jgi:hypothetical protein
MAFDKPTRRGLLQGIGGIGGIGLLGGGSFPALALAPGRRMVVIRAMGGWDVTHCMDPHLSTTVGGRLMVEGPDVNEDQTGDEEIAVYDGLEIMANRTKRPAVDTFFSAHAKDTVVVNGIYVGSLVHNECKVRVLTGTRSAAQPDLGLVASLSGSNSFAVPYLDLTGGAFLGGYAAYASQLGANNQIKVLLDRTLQFDGPAGSGLHYPGYLPNVAEADAIADFIGDRFTRMEQRGWGGSRSQKRIADFEAAADRRDRLMFEGEDFSESLSFGEIPTLDRQCELAVEMLQTGLCHSVAIEDAISWDSHVDNADQHVHFERLFGAINTLVANLEAVGMFEDTLIVVLSEMTRTPVRNGDGGKDHWSSTSAMLIGGGLEGARALGGTDSGLVPYGIDLASGMVDTDALQLGYDQFVAGVLHAVGVDPEEWLPGVGVLRGIVD